MRALVRTLSHDLSLMTKVGEICGFMILLESCFVRQKTRALVCRFYPMIRCISVTFSSLSDSSYVTVSSS